MSVASTTQMGNYEVEILRIAGTSLGLRSVTKSNERLPFAPLIVSVMKGFFGDVSWKF